MSLILPCGREDAQIMIVGDSADKHDTNACFTGNQWKVLKHNLKLGGLNFDACYKTLFIKQHIQNSTTKVGQRKNLREALMQHDHIGILKNEILRLQPKIIIPVGDLSFTHLTGLTSIQKYRGSILPLRNTLDTLFMLGKQPKVAPILPPQRYFAEPVMEQISLIDIKRIVRFLENPNSIEFVDPEIKIIKSVDDLLDYDAKVPIENFGVLDIETAFNIPLCCGISLSNDSAVVIPLIDPSYSVSTLVGLWTTLNEIFKKRNWVNQNISFDKINLERVGFRIPKIIGDTVINCGVLYPELKKNLGFLNSIYNSWPYHKDEGKDAKDRKALYTYCGKDCVVTRNIFVKQQTELEELNLIPFRNQVFELFDIYVRLQKRGILIDDTQRTKLLAKYDTLYNFKRSLLDKIVGKPTNPQSPQQVSYLLYNELHYPFRYDRKSKTPKTDEDTLIELMLFNSKTKTGTIDTTIPQAIIDCRKLKKVIEYLETITHPDNRLRSAYNIVGAATLRSSANATIDMLLVPGPNGRITTERCGRSTQTISKHGFKIDGMKVGNDLRSIFIPSPGYLFMEADGNGAEARVDAVLSKDYEILNKFEDPGIHVFTGEILYGRRISKKTEPELYFIAKTIRHAAERNAEARQVATQLHGIGWEGLPFDKYLEFCTTCLEKLHAAQPFIRQVFHKEIESFLKNNGCLVSPHGCRRDFFGRMNHHMINGAISQLPQTTVAFHTKYSMVLTEKIIGPQNWLYEAHDGVMAEVPKGKEEKLMETFSKVYERPINFSKCSLSRDFDLVIPCEVSLSENSWADLKEVKIK